MLCEQMQFFIKIINKNNVYVNYHCINKSMQINAYIMNNLKAGLIIGMNNLWTHGIDLLTIQDCILINDEEYLITYSGNYNKAGKEVYYTEAHVGKQAELYSKQAPFPEQKQGLLNVN